MRKIIIPTAILIFVGVSSAWCMDGRAHVECVNGEHVVTISGWYNEEFNGEISGLVLKVEAVGLCEDAEFVPEGLLPFNPQPNPDFFPLYETTVALVPPTAGVTYRYTPFGVRPDGALVSLFNYCGTDNRSYALAGCDIAPIVRGEVIIEDLGGGFLEIFVVPCESDCWTEGFRAFLDVETFESLAGEPWIDLHGQTVDVFGDRTYCAMAGGASHVITQIERAPGGACGPIPIQSTSWGSLKANYR